jgi:hypothetical protein
MMTTRPVKLIITIRYSLYTEKKMPTFADSNVSEVWRMIDFGWLDTTLKGKIYQHVKRAKYIHSGLILQWGQRKRKPKQRFLFLLGSVLLICKPVRHYRYDLRRAILITSQKIIDIVSDSTYQVPQVEFRLYSPFRTYIFFASSMGERDQWVQVMKTCVN